MSLHLFHCHASSTSGLGHLSRCLVLAEELRRRGQRCSFLARAIDGPLRRLPVERGFPVEDAPPAGRADWVIADDYRLTASDLTALAGAGRRLCVLDDTADRELSFAAVVVNAAPGTRALYPDLPGQRVLAGAAYALIARPFGGARDRAAVRQRPPRRLLLALGGAGDADAYASVAGGLRAHFPGARLLAVAGPTAPLPPAGLLEARRGLSPAELALEMESADLGILACSTVALEAACVRLPAVLVRTAANQARLAAALASLGVAVTDRLEALPALAAAAVRAPAFPPAAWDALVDGRGAERIADVLRMSAEPSAP